MSPPPRRTARLHLAVRIACIALLGFFAWLVYGFVFSNGLCCADDASIAVAAKNLAHGLGYATSVPFFGGTHLSTFDPALSTGPTLVCPAALVIRVFGATPWAPGFTAASFALATLACMPFALRRGVGATRALLYTTLLVFLLYCATAGATFVQWYALLGEIPAPLLCILGAVIVARGPESLRAVAIGCLLFGLAFTTKQLAVLAFVPVLLFMLVRLVMPGRNHYRNFLALLVAIGSYAIPAVVFECWKLVVLGARGYARNQQEFWVFFRSASDGTSSSVSMNARAFADFYGFSVITLMAAMIVVGLLVWIGGSTSSQAKRLFCSGYLLGAAPHVVHRAFAR